VELAQQLKVIFQQMSRVIDAVRETEELSIEGKRARRSLRGWTKQVRQLARQTGEENVIDKVEQVISHLKGELPNLFSGGSIN
jgi:transcription initiation factor IIE alpha subunit